MIKLTVKDAIELLELACYRVHEFENHIEIYNSKLDMSRCVDNSKLLDWDYIINSIIRYDSCKIGIDIGRNANMNGH